MIDGDSVFHDVQVSGPMPVEHIHNARECFLWICIAHVVEGTEGRNTYPNATRIPDVQDGLDDFTEKARPVGSTAAVSVGADVRFRPKELVNQVAVGSVNLHAIEASCLGIESSATIVLDRAPGSP